MKTRHLFTMAALAGAIMMTSCDNEFPLDSQEKTTDIQFTASLGNNNSATRASGESWAVNDKIGVFMYTHVQQSNQLLRLPWVPSGPGYPGNPSYPGNPGHPGSPGGPSTPPQQPEVQALDYLALNKKYITTDGSSKFAPANNHNKIILTSNDNVDFYAYYPWCENANSPGNKILFNVETNQTLENQPKFDYLWAVTDNKGSGYPKTYNGIIDFEFNHLLSMIQVNLYPGEGVSEEKIRNGIVRVLNVPTKGVFTPEKGSVEVHSKPERKTITMRKYSDKCKTSFEAIVLPFSRSCTQTNPCSPKMNDYGYCSMGGGCTELAPTCSTINVEIEVDGTIYKFEIDKNLDPSMRTVFEVTVNRNAINVKGSIVDWTTSSTESLNLKPSSL